MAQVVRDIEAVIAFRDQSLLQLSLWLRASLLSRIERLALIEIAIPGELLDPQLAYIKR